MARVLIVLSTFLTSALDGGFQLTPGCSLSPLSLYMKLGGPKNWCEELGGPLRLP
jgi:hypothetical protein